MNLDAFKEISKEYPELEATLNNVMDIESKIELARNDAEKITEQADAELEDAKAKHDASMKAAEDQRERADIYEKDLQAQTALIATFCSILAKQKAEFREELEKIGESCYDDATTTAIVGLLDKLNEQKTDEEEVEKDENGAPVLSQVV